MKINDTKSIKLHNKLLDIEHLYHINQPHIKSSFQFAKFAYDNQLIKKKKDLDKTTTSLNNTLQFGDIYKPTNTNNIVEDIESQIDEEHNSVSTSQQPSSIIKRLSISRNSPDELSPIDKITHRDYILAKRGAFVFLPVGGNNDVLEGCWWFVWGSIITTLIPLITLIALFAYMWKVPDILPLPSHAIAYSLLVLSGIIFTIGSYALTRVFNEPPLPPLFTWYHFSNDELFAFWMFCIGTILSIPIMIIYYVYNTSNSEFLLALIICIIFSIASFLYVLSTYPSRVKIDNDKHKQDNYFTPWLHKLSGNISTLLFHCPNDWLLSLWLMFICCFLATIISIGLLLNYLIFYDVLSIYSYATSFVNCFVYTIGSAYFIAGSYPLSHKMYFNIIRVAIEYNDIETIEYILMNENLSLEDIDNERSWTILHWASYLGKVDVVNYLIHKGANVNMISSTTSITPLILASSSNYQVCKSLIEANANVNQLRIGNHSALMHAADAGQLAICKLLINNGANIDILDENDQKAIDYAINNEYEDIINLLQKNKSYENESVIESSQVPVFPMKSMNRYSLDLKSKRPSFRGYVDTL